MPRYPIVALKAFVWMSAALGVGGLAWISDPVAIGMVQGCVIVTVMVAQMLDDLGPPASPWW